MILPTSLPTIIAFVSLIYCFPLFFSLLEYLPILAICLRLIVFLILFKNDLQYIVMILPYHMVIALGYSSM